MPLVVLRNPDQDPSDILWPALNIGYTVLGELAGGTAAWADDGGELATIRVVGPSDVDARVVDVRQISEHATGHLSGARLIELGRLAERVADLPATATTLMCGHGERAATAASLLERAGRRQLSIMVGGPEDWAHVTGWPLATGP